MRLKSLNYISPILTEGKFDEVFIEETEVVIKKNKKYMSITFEMYYFKNEERIVLDERVIAFYGMQGEKETSNKLATISVQNEDYDNQVATVPLTMQVPNPLYDPHETITVTNPDYNSEDPTSPILLTEANPNYNNQEFVETYNVNYDFQVSSIPKKVTIPFLQYLYTHEGQLPAEYEVITYGYPNFEDALKYFDGGDKTNPNITINNPFAKGWVLNNLIMKNEKVGTQFNFEN